MTLSRNNLIVRLAYLFNEEYQIPNQTNLCALFWRSMGMLTLVSTIGFMLSALVAFTVADIGWLWGFIVLIATPLAVIAGILLLIGIAVGIDNTIKWYKYDGKEKFENTNVGQVVLAVKHKYCPVISIKH